MRLRTTSGDEKALSKALDAGRMLYNACLGEALRRLNLMRQSKAYRKALSMPRGKERTEVFKGIRSHHGFKGSSIQSFAVATKNACHIGNHLDVHTVQKVATRAFDAANRYALGKNGRPRFKGKGQFSSLESKTNANGIKYRDGFIMWQGLQIPCIIDPEDKVVNYGLSCRIKYCRTVKRVIKGRDRFYAQLIVEGLPYQKDKNMHGNEVVGIDIGVSTIAYVGQTKAELRHLCAELRPLNRNIRLLQRSMDRSRRAANPGNYNPDGTIKKGRKQWVCSEEYKRIRTEVAELQRRRAEHRKSLHGQLANEILRVGKNIRIEKNSFKSFQRDYGKGIGNRAPGLFVSELVRKAESAGGEVWDMPAETLKLSQLCVCGRYKEKTLSERWHVCDCGTIAQRDMFSAFLARCTEKDGDKYILDMSRVQQLWLEAEPLLEQAVSRILEQSASGQALPASFGISSVSLRQSGSPVNLMLRSETGERTMAKAGDGVTVCSYRCGESPEEAVVAMRRTPSL
jgi:hypothetical protein